MNSLIVIMMMSGYPVEIDKYTFPDVEACERSIETAQLAGLVKVSGAQPNDIEVSKMPVVAMFCVPKK